MLSACAQACHSAPIVWESFAFRLMQPSFHCIANIGDATPLLHGGAFVMVDKRGCYSPELLILEPSGSDRYGDPTKWTRYSVTCDRLTAIKNANGVYAALSDNRYRVDHPAWFATPGYLDCLTSFTGETVEDVIKRAASSDPVSLASFYKELFDYYGAAEFQTEPCELDRKEAKALCRAMAEQVKEASAWHEGYCC
jgi:hypothetical protein